ncbi:Trafficking protein particle complex subunit 6B [Lachnellula occidentalis]|uniref:Trafficking protein particle complex subunit 6B n=1 Tax=Lachnellula occidentalis TaxID=215460 RepID=A0A8H8S3A2_9HELO|nr:Trafficking protein particle complex subunit 6B [Lachnellula occidentalis]
MSIPPFEQPLPPYNASDPAASFLSMSCLELLMIEIVPMAWRVVGDVGGDRNDSGDKNESKAESGGGGGAGNGGGGEGGEGGGGEGLGEGGGSLGGGNGVGEAEEEERDAVFYRLEGLGYRVGMGLVERFSKDRPRFTDTLDVIKFLCKDLWMLVFQKQIDNLKTNHRGVYVLTDAQFKPLKRLSAVPGGGGVVKAQPFLWFPCGIIRGALASMGINATVQAETADGFVATFQIKSVGVKA